MRLATILCLLIVTAVAAAPAAARGAGAAGGPTSLLARGYELLGRAEVARNRGEPVRARRDAAEAERIFLTAIKQDPRNREAILLGGQAATLAGDLERARAWIERYLALGPGMSRDPNLHYLVAFVDLLGHKRPDRALRSLTRMYALSPRTRPVERDKLWWVALSEYGSTLLRAKKYDEAIAQFRYGAVIARRLADRRKELMMIADVGTTLVHSDRFIEATEIYTGLTKADPKNPMWHFRLGICHANQTRFAEAVPAYREVIRLMKAGHAYPGAESELAQVDIRLGNTLRHLADIQRDPKNRAKLLTEAETLLRQYIAAKPEDSVGHYWLGVLLFENLNKPYEAEPHFAKAFSLDPICEGALRNLIQIHRNFPPPEGTAKEVWHAPLEGWQRDLKDGAERRKKLREERVRTLGSDGCG